MSLVGISGLAPFCGKGRDFSDDRLVAVNLSEVVV